MASEEDKGPLERDEESLGWVIVKVIGRIWFPVAVFVAFLSALLYRPEAYELFLKNSGWVSDKVFTYGVQIGAWLSSAFLANRLITVFFWDGFIGGLSERKVSRLPKDVTAILIFSIAGLAIASTVFHRDPTNIIAASGAVSIVVGLALRTVILDLFMGLAIHVDRPFKMGDWVMVHQNRVETHIVAEVIEINWRTTRLRTTRNNMVVVPNSKLGDTIVTNYMEPKPHFRMDLDFIIDFEVPSERAIRVLTAGIRAACENKGILDKPEPEVRMKESTLEGMVYEVRYFILPRYISPNDSKHVVNRTVLDHLINSGIMPAHSKEEVFLSRGKKRTLDASLDGDLYQLLTRTELFRDLNAEAFKELFSKMHKRTLAEGEVLYRQEEEGDSMFVCIEGLLGSAVESKEEGNVKIRTIRAGQYFGESAVLGDQRRQTTITTTTEALLYEIGSEALEPILAQYEKLRSRLQVSAEKATNQVKKKAKQAVEERATKPVVRKKTAMQKVVQAFFPGMFEGGTEEKDNKN
ncbi:MAG: mechanosensitive ion channel family protein [Verrucomicrobiota bacterium]|jgi:small-conductance mechanosensitive channel|nr:mechanosensitive ion channel family protein [Verrucomicrobiota bacterium]